MPLPAGSRIGTYEVLASLGAGGMGEVYHCRDARLQRPVAIKVIRESDAGVDLVRRFESEALSASALNHPNILTVHEFGFDSGCHYLVTELVQGETLRERIRRGPVPVAESVEIITQVAAALAAAHEVGLVHRDIKPENVMRRPDGLVKVLDFGLAKLAFGHSSSDSNTVSLRTLPGVIVGTMGYMSPEQVRGLAVDQRADIWSLGVVLHEMLTGHSPFAGETMSDTIAAVLEREPPPLRGGLPARLQAIVNKTLAKNAVDRYQNASDLLADLRELRQELETPVPQRASTEADGSRWTAWRVPVMLTLLILLAGGGWIAWRVAGGPRTPPISPETPPAVRSAELWLTVQRGEAGVAVGEPFVWNGKDALSAGWGFRLNFAPQSSGHLYVFNQGATDAGISLRVLFPRADGNSAIPAYQSVVLPDANRWFTLDLNPGKELLWIAWSAAPIGSLETATKWVKGPSSGDIRNPQELNEIQDLLGDHAQQTPRVDAGVRRVLRGERDILVTRVSIERR